MPRYLPISFLLLGALLSAIPTSAQDADDLMDLARAAYNEARYDESAALYAKAMNAGAAEATLAYNAACSFTLAGDTVAALRYLDRSIDLGWMDVDHMQSDGDLAALRNHPRWEELVKRARENAAREQRRWGGAAFDTPYREDLTRDEKLAGLSRLWAEVRFNFVNFDLVPDLDWDSLYIATIPEAAATTSTREYYRVLMATMAKIRDGHSNVYPPAELSDDFYSRPAFRTRRFGERVAVVSVSDDALREQGLEEGLEVVAIDGRPVAQYAAEEIRPYVSASTSQDVDTRTYEYMLLAGPAGPVDVSFRRADGSTFSRTVRRLSREEAKKLKESREAGSAGESGTPTRGRSKKESRSSAFHLEWLPGNIALVELNSFGTNEAAGQFAEAFDEIARADALILDGRENGGGSSGVGWEILAHLTDRPFSTSNWRTLDYRPAFRAWGRATGSYGDSGNTYFADASKFYDRPVVVLTSPRTYSAAEDFAVAFDAMDRGLLVGEPTGGSTGQPLFFGLPGGGRARVTTKRDTYPDGRDFVGVGVQPDVHIVPTIADLREGRDTVLKAALNELQSRKGIGTRK